MPVNRKRPKSTTSSRSLTAAVWEVAAQLATMNDRNRKTDEYNAAADAHDAERRDENNQKLLKMYSELASKLDRLGALELVFPPPSREM